MTLAQQKAYSRNFLLVLLAVSLFILACGFGGVVSSRPTPAPSVTPKPTIAGPLVGRIAYSYRGDIYVMNADGSGITQLTHDYKNGGLAGGNGNLEWSPDGQRLAYVHESASKSTENYINIINADGSNLIQTNVKIEFGESPKWSPDGTKIAFSVYADNYKHIFVMNSDGSDVVRFDNKNSQDEKYPDWSPDGMKIVFSGRLGETYVINADGSGRIDLTPNFPCGMNAPVWSPDGTKIAFECIQNIYVMNADGNGRINLTANFPCPESAPVWSPDGTKIAFKCSHDIYVMNADGSKLVNLTNSQSDSEYNYHPSWSPDGTKIVFVSDGTIYVMEADGSAATPLFHRDFYEYEVGDTAWAPH